MHILIISLPLHTNIGGILQSYALQTVLSRNGHDAIVLNRPFCSKPSVAKVLAKACCRLLKKMLGRETVPLFMTSSIIKNILSSVSILRHS